MAARKIDVKLVSTSMLHNPMQPPMSSLELRFHFNHRLLSRNLEGNTIEIEAYPNSQSSSFLFQIPHHHLFSQPPFKTHLDGLFSSLNLDDRLHDFLVYRVALFLVFLATKQSLLGFHVVVETVVTHEHWIHSDFTDLTMIMDEVPQQVSSRGASDFALNELKKQRVSAKDGAADGLSGDCAICLEELFGARDPLIKMTCNHIFHEKCISRWLKVRNSCPTCRRELED